MPKVYIVGHDGLIGEMFKANGWEVVQDWAYADLVQFTGGEDVSPVFYGSYNHRTTHFNILRDMKEAGIYAVCKRLDIPMAGICRGGQFLNVMCGGSMYQDVDGHAISGTHAAYDFEGTKYQVTSTHHQMMRPSVTGQTILYAEISTRKETDKEVFEGLGNDSLDIEAVLYPFDKVLCFQPHPEYLSPDHECQRLYFKFIKQYLELSA